MSRRAGPWSLTHPAACSHLHLVSDEQRTRQVTADVLAALSEDRNCLVLTNRSSHLERLADLLREAGHEPLILRGGMGAKSRAAALARLQPQPGGPPLLAVATGPYAGEGFDCPALDTLFLAAPVANKGSLTQYAGRILRSHENKTTGGESSAPLWLARCAERADAVEFGAKPVLLGLQVITGLQVQPEPLGSAEVPGQPQRRVRSDAALAVHDLIDPPGRDIDRLGQLVLAHTQRGEELLQQDLPRVARPSPERAPLRDCCGGVVLRRGRAQLGGDAAARASAQARASAASSTATSAWSMAQAA